MECCDYCCDGSCVGTQNTCKCYCLDDLAPEKKMFAVGVIHPPQGNYRFKELYWVDKNGKAWFTMEQVNRPLDDKYWTPLNGYSL